MSEPQNTIPYTIQDSTTYTELADFLVNHPTSSTPKDLLFKSTYGVDVQKQEDLKRAIESYLTILYCESQYKELGEDKVMIENGEVSLKYLRDYLTEVATGSQNYFKIRKSDLAIQIRFYDNFECVNWKPEEKLHSAAMLGMEIGGVHTVLRPGETGTQQNQQIEGTNYLFGDRTKYHMTPYEFMLTSIEEETISTSPTASDEYFIYIFRKKNEGNSESNLVLKCKYSGGKYHYKNEKNVKVQRNFIVLRNYYTHIGNSRPYYIVTSTFPLGENRIHQLAVDTSRKAKKLFVSKEDLEESVQYSNYTKQHVKEMAESEHRIPDNYDFIYSEIEGLSGKGCAVYLPDILKEAEERRVIFLNRYTEFNTWLNDPDRNKKAYIAMMINNLYRPKYNRMEDALQDYLNPPFENDLPETINTDAYIQYLVDENTLRKDWERAVDYAALNLLRILQDKNGLYNQHETYIYSPFKTCMKNFDWGADDDGETQDELQQLGQLIFFRFHENLEKNWFGNRYMDEDLDGMYSFESESEEGEPAEGNLPGECTYLRSLFDLKLREYARSNSWNSSTFSVTKKWTGATIQFTSKILPLLIYKFNDVYADAWTTAMHEREMLAFINNADDLALDDAREFVTLVRPSKTAKMTFEEIDGALESVEVRNYNAKKITEDLADKITGKNAGKICDALKDFFESVNLFLNAYAIYQIFNPSSENNAQLSKKEVILSFVSFAGALGDFMYDSGTLGPQIRQKVRNVFPKLTDVSKVGIRSSVVKALSKVGAIVDVGISAYNLIDSIADGSSRTGVCIGYAVELTGSVMLLCSTFSRFAMASGNIYLILAGLLLQGLGIFLCYINGESPFQSAVESWMGTSVFGAQNPNNNLEQQVRDLITLLYDIKVSCRFEVDQKNQTHWLLKIDIYSEVGTTLPRCMDVDVNDLCVEVHTSANQETKTSTTHLVTSDVNKLNVELMTMVYAENENDAEKIPTTLEQVYTSDHKLYGRKTDAESDEFTRLIFVKKYMSYRAPEPEIDSPDDSPPDLFQPEPRIEAGNVVITIKFFRELEVSFTHEIAMEGPHPSD